MNKTNDQKELDDVIRKLEAKGIHYENRKIDRLYFKCKEHPYLQKDLSNTLELFDKIGNCRTFDRPTMRLTITNANFSLPKY